MRSKLLAAGLIVAVAVTGVSAQKQFELFARVVDGTGNPPDTIDPANVRITEDDAEAKVTKVETVDWPVKLQVLLDNGIGLGGESLLQLRTGVKGLLESLPEGTEVTLVTTAPQPRFLVRATTDRAALLAGIDRITPDGGAGRFIESLNEATQRIERDKTNFFPVIISLGTTAGDVNVMERDVERLMRRLQEKPTLVHVIMLSAGSRSGSGGANQTQIGIAVTNYTGGRYENISAASRIATLLPDLGQAVAKSYGGQKGLFRLTVDRPDGKSGDLGKISLGTSGGLKATSISLDGRMR